VLLENKNKIFTISYIAMKSIPIIYKKMILGIFNFSISVYNNTIVLLYILNQVQMYMAAMEKKRRNGYEIEMETGNSHSSGAGHAGQ